MGRLSRVAGARAFVSAVGFAVFATACTTVYPATPTPSSIPAPVGSAIPTPVGSVVPPTLAEFSPGSVSMWSRRAFILGGATARDPGANVQVAGTVAITSDEGTSFSIVTLDSLPIVDVAVGPADEAWALGSSPDGLAPAPLFHSLDGGATWSALPAPPAQFSHIAFALDRHGFALAIAPGTEEQVAGIDATDDGGDSWTAVGNPCPVGTMLVGVATSGAASAWAGCVGQPGTIEQPKAIRWTNDGGATWTTTASVDPSSGQHLGNLPSQGHLTGLASGRGGNLWAMQDRGWPLLSFDGGRTWKQVHLGEIDVAAAFAMTRDDHRESLALVWNGDARAVQLVASHDDGDTWKVVRAFPFGS